MKLEAGLASMIPIIKPVVTSPAPCCLGREMGRIGNENLHGNRAKTDHQRGEKEWQWLSGKRRRKQGQCRYADNAKDQIPVFDEVAERHDQKQARPRAFRAELFSVTVKREVPRAESNFPLIPLLSRDPFGPSSQNPDCARRLTEFHKGGVAGTLQHVAIFMGVSMHHG